MPTTSTAFRLVAIVAVVIGTTYEFTETSDGSVYVRYLPEDAEIGDPSPDFLTVATYPPQHG